MDEKRSLNRKFHSIKNNQMYIPDLKKAEINNPQDRFTERFDIAQNKISELRDWSMEKSKTKHREWNRV